MSRRTGRGRLRGLAARLAVVGVLAGAGAEVAAQAPGTALDPELVRRALAGATDPAEWAALEEGAIAAADGPFVLREVRIADDALELRLGGYGLPTLAQTMKPGGATHVVVSLPGARSALPHGHTMAAPHPFESVRVQQGPGGVEVEALLAPGTAALIDESAGGIRIRPLEPGAVAPGATVVAEAGRAVPTLAGALTAFRDRVGSRLPAGGLALVPLALLPVVLLLVGGRLRARRGSRAVAGWARATDARRLAGRLAASVEP